MKYLTSNEIRSMWLSFFETKGHERMESASLIPEHDKSLLWINAGVTPLKKYFDGTVVPNNKRITNVQKCIRTNDIENVGVTKRHQTFFEMMGNFSIGDYFREEAIEFAYELLTSEEWFAIPKEKLFVTIYTRDDASFEKWTSLGMDPSHIVRLEENFWEIGEGPSGPDSEIFFDRGEKYDLNHDAFEKFQKDEDQERYIEIWNVVFSQYNAKAGVKREDYKELPHKNIDTGAGLERWCCIFQDVDSNFDTDLFTPLIKEISNMTNIKYEGQMSFKVIADHIRAITFALADGAVFENTGRGYVLRRLLRRSVRFGKKLGLMDPFLYKLVGTVIQMMKEAYPYLEDRGAEVTSLVYEEEKLFHTTLAAGERRLYELMEQSKDKEISGYDAFKLYDTYGFPFELTLEYLEEQEFTVSKEEFDRYMEEQKQQAKNSRKNKSSFGVQQEDLLNFQKESVFLYDTDQVKTTIIGMFQDGKSVTELKDQGYVILKKTCFYATSGGQVADIGTLEGKHLKAKVTDVIKAPNGQHIHKVELLEGTMKMKDNVVATIDWERRKKIAHNHSSVHILQSVLQEVLDRNVHQAGSYVDDKKFHFDFHYTGKISEEQLLLIEKRVREIIATSLATITEVMDLEEAKKTGAMALFDDKYQNKVRVVRIGESLELCGGTHVSNTMEIGAFALLSSESKGSNVYRITGVTGEEVTSAIEEAIKSYKEEMSRQLTKAKELLEAAKQDGISLFFDVILDHKMLGSYQDIIHYRNQTEYVQTEVKRLEKQYQEEKAKQATSSLDDYLKNVKKTKKCTYLLQIVEEQDVNLLKTIMDALTNQLGPSFVLFAMKKEPDHVTFLAKSSCDILAGLMVKDLSQQANGNGGGSSTFAQGGGKSDHLEDLLKTIEDKITHE